MNQLTQFTKAKTALMTRRNKLQAEVDKIDAALTSNNGHSESPRPRAASNKLTLREAIARVTKTRPLTKAEIVAAVQKIGYRFTTSDPINSTNALLYSAVGKQQFKNRGGKFGV